MDQSHVMAVFLTQLIVLLTVGRFLGEAMARIGQPAIFGQLLAGIVLGPSLFGALLPDLRAAVFPDSEQLRTMIDAISQVGIILLLLLTGMETNLELVRRKFHVVVSTSAAGIAIPFACGLALGFLLPASLVPDEGRQYVTALFIGTALSISSVKIVAMVLMEVGFIRRDLGQLILATAILDDTIAWILVAVIAGIAAQGSVSLGDVGISIAGVLIFLAVALSLGRRVVARLIRWSNDTLTIEFPVITVVLVVTLALALITDLIGVHSALGAFIGGVLIGQSPILKGHIEQELRGLIIAFFSPIFFAVAGLGMDLTTLAEPYMLTMALAFVAVATLGKSAGALIGGRLAGLSVRESVALATGLNARGSTEVIIATIGVSMGVLNTELYTLIVAMAVITTMIMPPTLRWALAKVPMRPEERQRLDEEAAAETEYLPNMERVLVTVDQGANAAQALRLAGAFAARQQILTTVMEPERTPAEVEVTLATDIARATAESVRAQAAALEDADPAKSGSTASQPPPVDTLIQKKTAEKEGVGEDEAVKGYSMVFVGMATPLQPDGKYLSEDLGRLLSAAEVPAAINFNGDPNAGAASLPRRILVTVSGTESARLAVEVAVALAVAGRGQVTFLHIVETPRESDVLRGVIGERISSTLNRAGVYAESKGIRPNSIQLTHSRPNRVIRRMADAGSFDLVVMGAELRKDHQLFLGPKTSELVRAIRTPLLLIIW